MNLLLMRSLIVATSLSMMHATYVMAAVHYQASVIELEQEPQDSHFADVNGDQRADLIISAWSAERGRELLLFLQHDDGHFVGSPNQRIEIKKDIVAYTTADVRSETGEELLFFTRNAVYSYSATKNGYGGNLAQLLSWDFINTVPDKTSVALVEPPKDLTGDGLIDLLLPGKEHFALFVGQIDEKFSLVANFPKPYRNPEKQRGQTQVNFNYEDGLTIEINMPSAFNSLIAQPLEERNEPVSNRRRGRRAQSILDVERWIAPVMQATLNRDQLTDFIYIDDIADLNDDTSKDAKDRHRLNVLYAQSQPSQIKNSQAARDDYVKVNWQTELDIKSELRLTDLDGDGLTDMYIIDRRGNDDATLRFYVNHDGRFDSENSQQVMRFSGIDVDLDVVDIDNDTKPELIVGYYTISAVDALRNGNMVRTTLLYDNSTESGELFSRRPQSKREDKFSATAFRGITQRINFNADVDGDKVKEAVAMDNDGALTASAVNKLTISNEPNWRFVPLHVIQQFELVDLNNDNSTDFLLHHQKALTVLVSQP
jgi:hypothetical protein